MTNISGKFKGRDLLAGCSLKGHLLRGAATLAVLPSVLSPAYAEDTEAGGGGDIIVTANRREADVSSIPYNISAISGEELTKAGVSDVQSLARQVPNLFVPSSGNRYLAAQVPIIRGLNASSTFTEASLAQSPVAIYLGNVEAGSYFPIDDVARVEVLRGPQGTLYGGGSLGGTVRIIPNDPKIGTFEGSVSGSAGLVSHSSDLDYSAGGVVNVPLGETVALRVSGKYEHTAGFIDNMFTMKTNGVKTAAVLADPGDYVNSSAIYGTKKDYNWSETVSLRGALKWEPSSTFNAVLAFNYAHFEGEGGNVDRASFTGATWPIDPTVTVPALGEYKTAAATPEPFSRDSYMASLDMSFDAGFATLSTTTSYMDTSGQGWTDNLGYAYFPDPAIVAYYTGIPTFPRYIVESTRIDKTKNFVNEARLVSNGDGPVSFTLGGYVQHQTGKDIWDTYAPGANEYFSQDGFFGITGDENGRLQSLAGDTTFNQQAVFGELTWSPTPALHVTGGFRVFHIKFKRTARNALFGWGVDEMTESSFSASDQIFKGNVSYDFAPDNMVYATFSQGFRRGGANAFPTSGFFYELEDLLPYTSDKVDNYEIGIKGRIGSWRYTFDLFDDEWKNPQIDTTSPYAAWPLVVNGDEARSRGVEAELSGLLTDNLSLVLGYAFADAKITKDFCIDTADGAGGLITCGIYGLKGGRLPGSPKHSGSATLNLDVPLNDTDSIGASLNVTYKGSVVSDLEKLNFVSSTLPDYFLVNFNASYTTGPMTFSLYARNVFDKRTVFSYRNVESPLLPNIAATSSVGTPRQVGISARYNF